MQEITNCLNEKHQWWVNSDWIVFLRDSAIGSDLCIESAVFSLFHTFFIFLYFCRSYVSPLWHRWNGFLDSKVRLQQSLWFIIVVLTAIASQWFIAGLVAFTNFVLLLNLFQDLSVIFSFIDAFHKKEIKRTDSRWDISRFQDKI